VRPRYAHGAVAVDPPFVGVGALASRNEPVDGLVASPHFPGEHQRRSLGGGTGVGRKLNYAGIGGAVAGVVSLLGIYSYWWSTETASYDGVADVSGRLALGMSIGLFAFGVAYVLISDRAIRRAMGALMTICAVVLTLACAWAVLRSDDVANGAAVELGLWVSAIGGILGIVASSLALRDAVAADAGSRSAAAGL
jgi:hypothetical protein